MYKELVGKRVYYFRKLPVDISCSVASGIVEYVKILPDKTVVKLDPGFEIEIEFILTSKKEIEDEILSIWEQADKLR